jgi:pyruvate dehydrogenase E1 component alpha subunit
LEDGLCGGMGGHMHLFSKDHLAASSGIVGSAGPGAAGFALAAQTLKTNGIAVGFFGDAAMNQGMLMESMNLASAWNLPVLFVCKDDGWGITTESGKMTGGRLADRVRGFDLLYMKADGRDVSAVWDAASKTVEHIRSGKGPAFLHATCVHLEGHFLGYQLIRVVRDPVREMPDIAGPLTQSFLRPGGGSLRDRLGGLKNVLSAVLTAMRDPRREAANDPVQRARGELESNSDRLTRLENQVEEEINTILSSALAEVNR